MNGVIACILQSVGLGAAMLGSRFAAAGVGITSTVAVMPEASRTPGGTLSIAV